MNTPDTSGDQSRLRTRYTLTYRVTASCRQPDAEFWPGFHHRPEVYLARAGRAVLDGTARLRGHRIEWTGDIVYLRDYDLGDGYLGSAAEAGEGALRHAIAAVWTVDPFRLGPLPEVSVRARILSITASEFDPDA